jgi:hypothetical protein
MNITKGVVQPEVSVSLVQPGAGGMQTLGTAATDVQGRFRIDKAAPEGPALLQANFRDVTYTLILQPGAPTTRLQMSVYDTTTRSASAKLAQHIWIFEPGDTDLHVSETFILENDTDATFQDPAKGSVQVYVPGGEPKNLEAIVEGTAGMSIRRQLEKTAQAGVYKLVYPIKPGEARIDITYSIPLAEKYSWKVLRTDGPTRIATPSGVTMTGTGFKDVGQEPRTQARIYELDAKASSFEATIKGSGVLRRRNAEEGKEDDGSPKAEVVDARVYRRVGWVLGLTFGILALGGALLYRKGTA